MTIDDLEAIEVRASKATPGPWRWQDWQTAGDPDLGPDKSTLTAPPETRQNYSAAMYPDLRNAVLQDEDRDCSEGDKAFIAHARTDIPLLLAEVRRLRTALNRIDAEYTSDINELKDIVSNALLD